MKMSKLKLKSYPNSKRRLKPKSVPERLIDFSSDHGHFLKWQVSAHEAMQLPNTPQ
jgi:hypothetical protein